MYIASVVLLTYNLLHTLPYRIWQGITINALQSLEQVYTLILKVLYAVEQLLLILLSQNKNPIYSLFKSWKSKDLFNGQWLINNHKNAYMLLITLTSLISVLRLHCTLKLYLDF